MRVEIQLGDKKDPKWGRGCVRETQKAMHKEGEVKEKDTEGEICRK